MPFATASQTIGPYWHLLEDPSWADLTRFGAPGERITLTGAVLDGDGKPCADACVEMWQSDPPGVRRVSRIWPQQHRRRRHVPVHNGEAGAGGGARQSQQAPHIALCILSRGLMRGLVTRAYFQGETLNDTDPLLLSIDEPARRGTLIAKPAGAGTWRMDVRLQGDGETVFLDV